MFITYEQISINYIQFFSTLTTLSYRIWQGMLLVDYKQIMTESRPFSWKISILGNFNPLGQWKTLIFLKNFSISLKPTSNGSCWLPCHINGPIFINSLHPTAEPEDVLFTIHLLHTLIALSYILYNSNLLRQRLKTQPWPQT